MMDCVVTPLIAAQDLSKQQITALENTLNDIPWAKGFEPQVHLYQSEHNAGDLRSQMLNESLKKVKTRYAAFLDFDAVFRSLLTARSTLPGTPLASRLADFSILSHASAMSFEALSRLPTA